MFTTITRLLKLQLLLFCFTLLTNFFTLNAQQWTYELNDIYLLHEVIELKTGGYLATGYVLDEYDASPNTYLLRLDADGKKLWSEEYILSSISDLGKQLLELPSGDILIFGDVGITNSAPRHREAFRLFVNSVGTVIRQENLVGTFETTAKDLIATTDGGYLTTSVRRHLATNVLSTVVTKFGADHIQQWEQIIADRSTDTDQTTLAANGNIYIGLNNGEITELNALGAIQQQLTNFPATDNLQTTTNNEFIVVDDPTVGTSFYRLNTTGETIFTYASTAITDELQEVVPQPDGSYLLYGSSTNGTVRRVWLENISATGEVIWSREITQLVDYPQGAYNLLSTRDGGYVLNTNEDNDRVYLIKTDSRGIFYTSQLMGRVEYSLTADCNNFTDPRPLANWIVTATNEERTFYATTDSTGHYELPLAEGAYAVTTVPPVPIWELCQPPQTVNISNAQDTVLQHLKAIPLTECPHPTVQLSAPFLRRCFMNDYSVTYCNRGAVPITNSEITITFDPFLEVVESTLAWSDFDETTNTYTFPIGDIPIGECERFKVRVLVNCESELGQRHCSEAVISPIERCPLVGNDWSGSNLEADGVCEGDSIRFTIENVGVGDTEDDVQYFIVEGDLVILLDVISVDSDQMIDITIPSQIGKSYRLEVKQEASNPYATFAAAEVFNCNGESDGDLLANEFDQPDEWDYIDIDCHRNVGSYDPNDKMAFPIGFSEAHLIEANTDLEYHIRFQNTGTDTAFTVMIKDTIDQNLQLASLEVLTASHDYRMEIRDDRELTFIFDNILLPDSTTNEPASHGFIRFLIEQAPDLADDTQLANRAGIYFDFNDPIITNTVFHTIGSDFIEMISSTHQADFSEIAMKIAPHPVADQAIFKFAHLPNEMLNFQLFNTKGQLLRTEGIHAEQFIFQRQNLAAGLYFFQLVGERGIWYSGKLMIQ